MHYKKRKLFVLYSIPAWFRKRINSFSKSNLCKEKLYLVSYSIPLSCMVVLLLGLGMIVAPDLFGNVSGIGSEKTYAVDGAARANVNPVLGLAVTNSDKVIETVQGGNTAYSDHVVTISGVELANYTLSMSSSSSNLTKPSGTNGANITGAGGVAGNSMPANRWGYAVTEESASDSSYGGLTYNTVPTAATKIAEGNAAADGTLNAKKKIVIAAKFGEDAAPGTYRQTISLSAVANPTIVTFKITYDSNGGGTAPAAVTQNSMENSVNFTLAGQGSMSKSGYKFVGWSTDQNATSGIAAGSSYTVNRTQPQVTLYAVWQLIFGEWSNGTISGVTNMQDINSGFCTSSLPIGATIKLKDSRDSQGYTIVKLRDGKCWMQENLRLNAITDAGLLLTSNDSGISSGWTLPKTKVGSGTTLSSGWGGTTTNSVSATFNNANYGTYYNWCAATAGTCASATTGGAVASGSICPKGWHLPTGGINGELYRLTNGLSMSSVIASPYLFPAAGTIEYGSVDLAGSAGCYWSSTSYASDSSDYGKFAYYLSFRDGETFYPGTTYRWRHYGCSVRCVANY